MELFRSVNLYYFTDLLLWDKTQYEETSEETFKLKILSK